MILALTMKLALKAKTLLNKSNPSKSRSIAGAAKDVPNELIALENWKFQTVPLCQRMSLSNFNYHKTCARSLLEDDCWCFLAVW
jgi:hypothetical protein